MTYDLVASARHFAVKASVKDGMSQTEAERWLRDAYIAGLTAAAEVATANRHISTAHEVIALREMIRAKEHL